MLTECVDFVSIRLPHDDPVWRAHTPPHDIQGRQYRPDVLELGFVFDAREVDDHAAVRVTQRVEQRARSRRTIVSPEHSDARKCVERPVITLRVDDAQAVTVKDLALADQAGQPPLAEFVSPMMSMFRPRTASANSRPSAVRPKVRRRLARTGRGSRPLAAMRPIQSPTTAGRNH
jgi:hypothetical protein